MIETLTAKDWLMAGSSVLGSALKGGSPGGPSSAFGISPTTTETNSWLDSSGWTVATGASSAKGGDRAQSESAAQPFTMAAALVGLLIVAFAMKGLRK